MILFKAELVEKIRTCHCGHDFLEHYHSETLGDWCVLCTCSTWDALKTQTRRFWKSARAKAGALHNANVSYYTTTGLRIGIKRVWEEDPEAISEADAKAEGFPSRAAFLEYFHSINDRRSLDGRIPFAIEFRLHSVS